MDDFFLMSPSLSTTQELLHCATRALSWARKSLCITASADHQIIQSISVRFFGRTILGALSDNYQPDSLTLALSKGLGLISNCHHCLAQKLWTLQHRLVLSLITILLMCTLVKPPMENLFFTKLSTSFFPKLTINIFIKFSTSFFTAFVFSHPYVLIFICQNIFLSVRIFFICD